MHLHEAVHLLDLGAGAGRDAALAAGVERLGVAALVRGHRGDDGVLALEDAVVEVGAGDLRLDLAHAGHHAEHARHPADLLHLL